MLTANSVSNLKYVSNTSAFTIMPKQTFRIHFQSTLSCVIFQNKAFRGRYRAEKTADVSNALHTSASTSASSWCGASNFSSEHLNHSSSWCYKWIAFDWRDVIKLRQCDWAHALPVTWQTQIESLGRMGIQDCKIAALENGSFASIQPMSSWA